MLCLRVVWTRIRPCSLGLGRGTVSGSTGVAPALVRGLEYCGGQGRAGSCWPTICRLVLLSRLNCTVCRIFCRSTVCEILRNGWLTGTLTNYRLWSENAGPRCFHPAQALVVVNLQLILTAPACLALSPSTPLDTQTIKSPSLVGPAAPQSATYLQAFIVKRDPVSTKATLRSALHGQVTNSIQASAPADCFPLSAFTNIQEQAHPRIPPAQRAAWIHLPLHLTYSHPLRRTSPGLPKTRSRKLQLSNPLKQVTVKSPLIVMINLSSTRRGPSGAGRF